MSLDLIRRHLDGLATPAERAELGRLLASDPTLADAFARESRLHAALEDAHRQDSAAHAVTRRLRAASRRRLWVPLASAAALLLAAGLWLLRPAPVADFGDRAVRAGDEIEGPGELRWRGEETRLRLRPGARLSLAEAKRVELRGGTLEAEIAKQPPGSAFLLETPGADVRVLGTRFTLSASGSRTVLDVDEGRVRLMRRADAAAIEVGAREAAIAEPDRPLAPRPADEVRFLELRRELHDPANGYFSRDGIPYHSIETLIVDAPDYGHLTTSETFSYWITLEAAYGRLTGDWEPLRRAWRTMERTLIPAAQPGNGAYAPERPSTAAAEGARIEDYPVVLLPDVPVGRDPLAAELRATHGTPDLYAMHWLADPDGWYGFGRGALVNTFQRGPQESVWETIPHPSVEEFRWGGPNGFLDRFLKEPSYARQWRYVSAPDAEARVLQALALAVFGARERGQDPRAVLPLKEAARLGDTMRYALHGKRFTGKHGLIGWSVGWGGSLDPASPWAWRLGSDHVHMGYQNPAAAWALAELPELRPPSPGAAADWRESAARQVEFLAWLQSPQGALAGGARLGGSDFKNLAYDPHPVFLDPPSNEWFGWQAWCMERVMQHAALSKDPAAAALADRWAAWARSVLKLPPDGTYAFPAALRWSGKPGSLRVEVASETQDVGVAGALARALLLHSNPDSRRMGRELLARVWTLHRDERGVSNPEPREDYRRFEDPVPMPPGRPPETFLSLRPQYRKDPDFAKLRGPSPPVFRYHRFWAQVEVALALAESARLSR